MNSITHVFNRDADTVGLYELVDGWGLGIKLGLETEKMGIETLCTVVCVCVRTHILWCT